VTRDVIERAVKKGAGIGGEKLVMDHIVFEGYTPHKVPVIVEVMTDNNNRTAPEMRLLFKKGQLGTPGSNKFLFDHVGLVEAHHPDAATDIEGAAIEAGAQNVEPLTHAENDDIPEGVTGARFIGIEATRLETSACQLPLVSITPLERPVVPPVLARKPSSSAVPARRSGTGSSEPISISSIQLSVPAIG